MSVEINTVPIQYKGTDGNYIIANAFTTQPLETYVNQIEAAAAEAEQNIRTLGANSTQLLKVFSPTQSYKMGEYVLYQESANEPFKIYRARAELPATLTDPIPWSFRHWEEISDIGQLGVIGARRKNLFDKNSDFSQTKTTGIVRSSPNGSAQFTEDGYTIDGTDINRGLLYYIKFSDATCLMYRAINTANAPIPAHLKAGTYTLSARVWMVDNYQASESSPYSLRENSNKIYASIGLTHSVLTPLTTERNGTEICPNDTTSEDSPIRFVGYLKHTATLTADEPWAIRIEPVYDTNIGTIIDQIQLEVGDKATDYEDEPVLTAMDEYARNEIEDIKSNCTTLNESVDDLKSALVNEVDSVITHPLELDFDIISGGTTATGDSTSNTARGRTTYIDSITAETTYEFKLDDPEYVIINAVTYSNGAGSAYFIRNFYPIANNRIVIRTSPTEKRIRISFAHADKISEITSSDLTAIKSSLTITTLTDTNLLSNGVPADAKAIGMKFNTVDYRINSTNKDIAQIANAEIIDWTEYGTELNPTGWRNGYYRTDSGVYSNSNLYLCSLNMIMFAENIKSISVSAPEGYGMRVTEIDANNVVTQYGVSSGDSLTQFVRVDIKPEASYGFTLGRFNSGDSGNYNTEEFTSQIVATTMVDVFNEFKDVLESLVTKSTYDWSELGTSEYPTGWQNGYYKNADGAKKTSYFYLCSVSGITFAENVTDFTITPHSGYGVKVAMYDANSNYLGALGNYNSIDFPLHVFVSKGITYKFNIGRFNNQDSNTYNTEEFVSSIVLTTNTLKNSVKTKKARTGQFEFFTIETERPLPFGGEEVNTTTETVECVLRLPTAYDPAGTPTRLVLACHGASGYLQASNETWYNSNWKSFMDTLLNAGYAVFDANIFPTSVGTSSMGKAFGSPLYVNVLKKAYDYIVNNYNVMEKIFVHGTSMGGVGASAFANAYPHLVLAESSFAGRDLTQYIYQVATGEYDNDSDFAAAWGYNNMDELNTDKWSHIKGSGFSLSLLKYSSGLLEYPPDRETDYTNWLAYFGEVQSHGKNDTIGQYIARRIVPYKTWDSWNDNVGRTKAKLILQKAFNAGSSVPYEVVIDDTWTHTELSYGMSIEDQTRTNTMREQLIAWYKRWE